MDGSVESKGNTVDPQLSGPGDCVKLLVTEMQFVLGGNVQ